jgi:hypothetical protein
LLIIAPVFVALLIQSLWSRNLIRVASAIGYAATSTVLALLLFLLLNPAWWTAPFKMPEVVVDLRRDMMTAQTGGDSTFTGNADRLLALIRYPFGPLQYEEDAKFDWTQWIGNDITAYEASGLWGINWYGGGLVLYGVLLAGGIGLLIKRRDLEFILCFLVIATLGGLWVTNPLSWQRYYLPACALLTVMAGAGLAFIWQIITTFRKPRMLTQPS